MPIFSSQASTRPARPAPGQHQASQASSRTEVSTPKLACARPAPDRRSSREPSDLTPRVVHLPPPAVLRGSVSISLYGPSAWQEFRANGAVPGRETRGLPFSRELHLSEVRVGPGRAPGAPREREREIVRERTRVRIIYIYIYIYTYIYIYIYTTHIFLPRGWGLGGEGRTGLGSTAPGLRSETADSRTV